MWLLRAIIGLAAAGILAAEPDTATIIDSGSTNRAGFRIVVNRSGIAERTATAVPLQKTVPRALLNRFYADLSAAKPLTSLPAVHCMKSASFGSSLFVLFGGEQTPDLSCGDGGHKVMGNLIRDAMEIVALFQDE